MLDEDLLKAIASELMTNASVRVEEQSFPVRRTSNSGTLNCS
jgi:hypothetical protein